MKFILSFFILLMQMPFLCSVHLSPENFHLNHNLQKKFLQFIAEAFHADEFVETGTYIGETAENASYIFNKVYTVELSKKQYLEAKHRLRAFTNIYFFLDNSSHFLNEHVKNFSPNTIFWLDAHYSAGGTTAIFENGKPKSPLIDELSIILKNLKPSQVILIDDIRHYANFPSHFRYCDIYPKVYQIAKLVKDSSKSLNFSILGDIGLVFDSKYHSVSISKYFEAMTASYLFNPESYREKDIKNVITKELFLTHKNESNAIDLSIDLGYCSNDTFYHKYHYILWHGLRALGLGKYANAAKDFTKLLNVKDFVQPRLYLYLAKCYLHMNQIRQAKNCFSYLDPIHKKYINLVFDDDELCLLDL